MSRTTGEKGYSHRPDLTSSTTRIILVGISRVDGVHGPDVRRIQDCPAKPYAAPTPSPAAAPLAVSATVLTVVLTLLAIAWPACAAC
jgi:hypothetical protein